MSDHKELVKKAEILNAIKVFLKFEVIFLDYDRYRSANHEQFDAVVHASEYDNPVSNTHYPHALGSNKTDYWKVFSSIRNKIREKGTSNSSELISFVYKKINTLQLDEEYLRDNIFNIYSAFRQKNAPNPKYIKAEVNQTHFKKTVKRISALYERESFAACNTESKAEARGL